MKQSPPSAWASGAVAAGRWSRWPWRPPRWPPTSNPHARFVQIRSVDALNAASPNIALLRPRAAGQGAPPKIVGQRQSRSRRARRRCSRRARPGGIAVVLDTSDRGRDLRFAGGGQGGARSAGSRVAPAHRLIDEQFAIYAANDTGVLGPGLHQRHRQAGGGHQPGGARPPTEAARSKTALWSAVRQAARRPRATTATSSPSCVIMARPGRQRQRRPAEGGHRRDGQRQHPGVQLWPTPAVATTPSTLQSLSSSYGGEVLDHRPGPVHRRPGGQDAGHHRQQPVHGHLRLDGQGQPGRRPVAQPPAARPRASYYTGGTSTVGFYNLSQTANGADQDRRVDAAGQRSACYLAVLLVLVAVADGGLRHHPARHPRQQPRTRSCSPTPRATAPRTSSRRATPPTPRRPSSSGPSRSPSSSPTARATCAGPRTRWSGPTCRCVPARRCSSTPPW